MVSLHKEVDLLFSILNKNNIKLNVRTIYFGGGSPTILNKDDLKIFVDKLKSYFDFSKVNELQSRQIQGELMKKDLYGIMKTVVPIEYLLECKTLTMKFKEE